LVIEYTNWLYMAIMHHKAQRNGVKIID
jgi:hypothetical protein